MSIVQLLLTLLVWSAACVTCAPRSVSFTTDDFELSLLAVFTVIRHGDRSPTTFYPNDPFQNESFWPEGIGEMNPAGLQRMRESGRLYLERYQQFLQTTNGWPKYAKSSVRQRSIDSAELFLESFLAHDQPSVNVSSIVETDQLMLTTTYPCNRSNNAWLTWFSSEEVTGYIKSQENGIKHLEQLTGDHYLSQTPFTLRNLEFLATTLEIERDEYKLDVPEWAKDRANIELMADLKRHAYLFDWRPVEVQRYRVGPLLGNIRDNSVEVVESRDNQRFFLYSTHDVNQVLLLQALKLYDQVDNWPPSYSSAIVVELYNYTGTAYVRLLYREVSQSNVSFTAPSAFHLVDHPLNITACVGVEWTFEPNKPESLCPLNQFSSLIQPLVPLNYDQECRTTSSSQSLLWRNGHLLLILSLFSIVAFVATL